MGLFVNNWDENQRLLFDIKAAGSTGLIDGFILVLTQYAVSQWIWFGGKQKTNRSPHRSPVYLLSFCIFLYVSNTVFEWNFLGNHSVEGFYTTPLGEWIAFYVIVVLGVPLNMVFCWLWTKLFPITDDSEDATSNDNKNNENAEESTAVASVPGGDVETAIEPAEKTPVAAAPTTAKPSILYINNIKIFLTVMVILVHCFSRLQIFQFSGTLMFGAQPAVGTWGEIVLVTNMVLQQSYFMNLFFFFSGYFVPRSFDKRGAYVFIMDRAKRLGIPYVVGSLFLFPFTDELIQYAFHTETYETFTFKKYDAGPVWFLAQLILFSILYAFLCGKGWSPKVSCPSLLGFFGIAVVLGLQSGILQLFFDWASSVMYVPLFSSFYISYVVFFFGGALASRNNWMEDIRKKSRVVIYLWAAISLASSAGYFYMHAWPFVLQRLYFGFFLFGGMCTMSLSLAVTVFFMDVLDRKFFFTDFFAKSMYTAYIIHVYITVPIAAYFMLVIFEMTGNIIYANTLEIWASISPEGTDPAILASLPPVYFFVDNAMFFPAVMLVCVFTMIITWPLAYGIRSIPGFDQVL